jgi:hypothetical protein
MGKNSEHKGQVREKEEADGKAKSRTSARRAVLKGASLTPHLRRQARRVSEAFAHARTRPGETTAHSRDASVLAECELAESACGHVRRVSRDARVHNCAHVTTTAMTAPTKCPQVTMATITNKSS